MLFLSKQDEYQVDMDNVIYRDFGKPQNVPEILKKHSNDIIDLLWESALIGICLVNEDGRFIRVNSTFCQVVKYTETELLDLTFMDITVGEDIKNDMKSSRRVATGELHFYDMTKTYETKLGEEIPALLRVLRLADGDDEFICFVSQILPIKQKKNPKPYKKPKVEGKTIFGVPVWTVIAGVCSALAVVTAEVIKILNS